MGIINYLKLFYVYFKVFKKLKKNRLYTLKDLKATFKIVKLLINEILQNKKTSYNLLRVGNHKLEKNIIIWDIPVGMTCKGICQNCYALKSERIYKNTRVMRLYHLILLEYAFIDKIFYKKLLQVLSNELQTHQKKCTKKNLTPICRIHSSGDIYNKQYKIFLLQLRHINKNINFYTYTKQLDNNTIDKINNTYNNFNIVKSLIDINGKKFINFGNIDYINNVANQLKANNQAYKICDYGINNNIICGHNCKACLNCSNVLFKKH